MDFLDYVKSLNPSTFVMPILGNMNTLDGYNRNVTEVGSPQWNRSTRNGYGVSFPYGDFIRYEIDHGAEQIGYTDFSIYVHFTKTFTKIVDPQQEMVAKWDVLGRAWLTQVKSNEKFYLFNSSGQQRNSSPYNFTGHKSCVTTSINNSSINFYFDGNFMISYGGYDFTTQPAAIISVGGRYNNRFYNSINQLGCFAFFNYVLSNDQIRELHMAFERLIVTTREL